MEFISEKLTNYALWLRVSPVPHLGYGRLAISCCWQDYPAYELQPVEISDEEAMLIDTAIARLRQRKASVAEALMVYYLSKENTSYVARELGMDRRKVTQLVSMGESWVAAWLEKDSESSSSSICID
ncbi:antiterminator Q family protein [Desulfotalea psychrophila]|uniref:RNA polymerase sigma factor 70 region 4 type 2 domain-containing protein n=1 Tax=Desulfotalea psychrophila (strain LSv54 / DSM 12343) TaxID=177439 RepID=Q6ALN5_DESPS|nr:antiterminator Q family protein [Desulfotalea psychrophila]CAG36740.1 unknown protein [Desulfotalea psychrophila LSv54]